ncbi:ABC transporter substrate-binding protein [uncultured Enterovirga sp.]|uniref:ABC transporter substrate-binding protein n=1 Tax=uncultured Enterovirga sp. TaxID=2026352 RepID=UPI0035C9B682
MMRRFGLALALLAAMPLAARAEIDELRIPVGAGGIGFLPLLVMEKQKLVEKHALAAGLDKLKVSWISFGGPSVVNDALLSGSSHFAPAGPPAFLTMWGRTRGAQKVMGAAAMTSMPMYLNTNQDRIKTLEDIRDGDKMAVTAVKVSIPAIIMQMYARDKFGPKEYDRFDRYTVSMTHPDGVIALLSKRLEVNLHFTSPPFHQRELKDPAIRNIMNSDQVMGGATTFTMLYTTTRFHDENPKTYGAVMAALREALAFIKREPRAATRIFLEAGDGRGWTEDEIAAVIESPDVVFTTAPQNVMKYATFMHEVGTLKIRPSSWKDLFFPNAHDQDGT